MTCRDVTGFLLDYLEGVLPPDTRVAFERHLDDCANCRAFLTQYRSTVAAGRAAFAASDTVAELPEDLVQRILTVLRDAT